MTKDDALLLFRNNLEFRNLSPNTVRMYSWYVSVFLDRYPLINPGSLSLVEAQEHVLFLKNEIGYKPSSLNCVICALRYFFDVVLNISFSRRQFPNIIYDQRDFFIFSDDQIIDLISHADCRLRSWIFLGFDCGLRASEVCALRISDIDSKNMVIHIRNSKRHKSRTVKLSAACLGALRDYWRVYRSDDYLYPGRKNPSVNVASVHRDFHILLSSLYMDSPEIHFHCLRHTFATRMLESGCDIFLLKKLMGHSNLASTAVYIHKIDKDVKESFSLSDRMELSK